MRAMATAAAPPAAEAARPVEKFRKDYAPVPYAVDTIHLDFVLNEELTTVATTMSMQPNAAKAPLFLNGRDDLTLQAVAINGAAVPPEHYTQTPAGLTIAAEAIPDGPWQLVITTAIKPQDNSSLEGLYKSGGNFCTQCEAEGFRGITFFLDRPDVMSK